MNELWGYANKNGGPWCKECYGTKGSIPDYTIFESDDSEQIEICASCGKTIWGALRKPTDPVLDDPPGESWNIDL
jgi:hypothetical protein